MQNSRESETPAAIGVFRFGAFELNPGRVTLMKNGVEIPLRRQCFDVLMYLVRHRGGLVTKQELMEAVWPDVVVTDASVPQCICTIRRALGDDEKTLIRSIPRSGYLFDVPVVQDEIPAIPETDSFPPARAAGFPRYTAIVAAVLAIVLFLLPGLKSLPVTRSAETSYLAENYDVRANALTEISTPGESKTGNPEAASHYQLGKYFHGRRAPGDIERTIDQFRSAVAVDPGFADAWVGLAGALWLKSVDDVDAQAVKTREETVYALKKALELDPNQPEANARLAAHYRRIGRPEEAQEYSDRAVRFGQNNARVLSFAAFKALQQLRYTEAIELQRQSAMLEPLSYISQSNFGHILRFAGRLDEAIEVYLTALDLDQESTVVVLEGLFRCYFLQGRYDLAEAVALRLPDGSVRDWSSALLNIARDNPAGRDAMIRRLSGRSEHEDFFRLAEIYAYEGDTDASFQWLARGTDTVLHAERNNTSHLCARDMIHSNFMRPLQEDDRWDAWLAKAERRDFTERGPLLTLNESPGAAPNQN